MNNKSPFKCNLYINNWEKEKKHLIIPSIRNWKIHNFSKWHATSQIYGVDFFIVSSHFIHLLEMCICELIIIEDKFKC